jgi:uncharacterized phage protein (TIGR02216 family)
MSAAPLAWGDLMRAGLGGLGLSPAAFWDLTPAELSLMLGRAGAPGALRREGLAALMAAYPDGAEGEKEDG